MTTPHFVRPPLDAALKAWTACLSRHGLPAQPRWVFAENVCIERSQAVPGSLHIGFQTKFTPPDEDALELAYDRFCETDARIVFYRLGSSANQSVCILLCDSWFEEKAGRDGFERRDDWRLSFRPGYAGDIEEITELTRWVRRVRRDRAFHDFDFSMPLATLDEIKIHGRPLLPYERMAQTMLNRLRRMLGEGQ